MLKNLWKLATVALALVLFGGLTTSVAASPAVQAENDIVEVAIEDGRFTTLVTALQEAELVDTLKSEGPFTVFAPTDDAFAALPEGVLENLLADKAALTDVLLYHVVAGKVMAEEVTGLETADTVLGEPLPITVEDGNVMVGTANVILTDIEGSNGVIHVIDSVLVPASVAATLENNAAVETADTAPAEADESTEPAETTESEAEAEAVTEQPAPGALPTTGIETGPTSQPAILAMIVVVGVALVTGGLARLRSEER